MTTQTDAPAAAATREAYGPTLIKLADAGYDIVVLDADLSASTGSIKLRAEHPERWYTLGAAEQNMISMAAGLAAAGKTASVRPSRSSCQATVSTRSGSPSCSHGST